MRRARKLVADIRKLDHCVLVLPQDSEALVLGLGHKQYHKNILLLDINNITKSISAQQGHSAPMDQDKRRLFHSHV